MFSLPRYAESSQILFETVTPVFTASADAYRFFFTLPRPFKNSLQHLRHLELNLTQKDDRIYLTKRALAVYKGPALPHVPYGANLWWKLIERIRKAAPALRHLDINIGSSMRPRDVLQPFGQMVTSFDPNTGGEEDLPAPSEWSRFIEGLRRQRAQLHHTWVLPEKLVVQFRARDDTRVVYVQDGKRLVKRDVIAPGW
jgi:hypothetical protein